MSTGLNNVPTADVYTETATIVGRTSDRVNIIVEDNAVFYQLQADSGEGRGPVMGSWYPERYLPVGTGGIFTVSLSRRATGIRLRSAVAGLPARVTIEMITRDELGRQERQ